MLELLELKESKLAGYKPTILKTVDSYILATTN